MKETQKRLEGQQHPANCTFALEVVPTLKIMITAGGQLESNDPFAPNGEWLIPKTR